MTTNPESLRILVLARDPLARAGLVAMLAGQPGLSVAGQAAGAADLPQVLDSEMPDVVLWDLGWDPSNALGDLADLPEGTPPVLALVAEASRAAEAWAGGARGLLPRDAPAEVIAAVLQALALGLAVQDPALLPPPSSRFYRDQQPSQAALPEDLTPRERQVLALLAEGLPNKVIAGRLSISDHTVKFHINAIMGKLGAQSRTEAVVLATRLGLVTM